MSLPSAAPRSARWWGAWGKGNKSRWSIAALLAREARDACAGPRERRGWDFATAEQRLEWWNAILVPGPDFAHAFAQTLRGEWH